MNEVEQYQAGELYVNSLAHHGVKGMHWGEHKAGSESYSSIHERTQAIHKARADHAERMAKIDDHVHKATIAKSPAEAKKHIEAINKLAQDPQAQKELDIGGRTTLGEKIAAGLIGSVVATPGIGTGAGVGAGQLAAAAHRKSEAAKLDVYSRLNASNVK